MNSRTPPVPEENRSPKGTGEPAHVSNAETDKKTVSPKDPDKTGQQGNINVNTHNQGYQQDR
ncbi:hypothetical protein [Rhizobium sp. L1K21]|uniref:hypothetical protein n=1 Tax=Rhizobium sp. L1K21 TaxID=2954933 RepID=UPI00209229B2|nr:hypothetical protein [Rhizobium sp. L1K21]MCO6187837.1 hypothetical protein [Rhizobium sp. L1K21]